MLKRTIVSCLSLLAAAVVLGTPLVAEAQYGYGYAPPPPPPPPQWGYRHRIHGFVGAEVVGMGIINQRLEYTGHVGSGGGFGLYGGVRLGPFFSLEGNWTFTVHDESWGCPAGSLDCPGGSWTDINALQVQTATVNAKVHIPTRGMLEPFFQGGVGWAFLGVTGNQWQSGYLYKNGPTFNLGGGLDLWLGPFFTLGAKLLYEGLYFTSSETGLAKTEANFVSAIRFDLNLGIHF
jgi:hypothetical protein